MKIKDIQKAEFWTATIVYIFAIINLISNANNRDHGYGYEYYHFKGAGLAYSYLSNYFIPELFRFSLLYISFLLINFCVIPSLIKKKDELLNYFLVFILFISSGIITGICKTYSHAYLLLEYDTLQQAYNRIFFSAFTYTIWLIIMIAAYGLIRELTVYLMANKHKNMETQNQMKVDIAVGLAFWLVGLLLWVTSNSAFEICIIWTLVIFAAIGIVVYAVYYLLPHMPPENRRFRTYFWQVFFIAVLLVIPISLISLFFFYPRGEGVLITGLFHLPTQLLVSAPLAWYIYKRRLANTTELTSLRTELGKSDASLSFLQSQINPHFLFNALNTLYGTALQENAERTGEGIQKLGDMMRFMLHENVQDKISLTRDVDYLENYISLQKLRTSRSSSIVIETQIDEQLNNLQITPMLLIPFVENAFKHGISLQQPSHIKVTLQTKANTLYFDVHNSIHIKPDNDPEKLKSGIGLANVKQRLALLYPGKHELIIRESAKEFFIHLTIQL